MAESECGEGDSDYFHGFREGLAGARTAVGSRVGVLTGTGTGYDWVTHVPMTQVPVTKYGKSWATGLL